MKKQMEWVADKNATACPTYNVYRYAVWLYVVLLVFEGALRKWVLPSLATPLLVVRDPIAIWLVVEGLRRKWFVSPYFRVMMIAATLSFFLTLVAGHHNLLVALFGWRIYFFHFPMILVIGKVLARDELLRMLRFFLYLSVPMTLLVVVQFYSPDTAWVNIGVGGEGTAGFGGAMGYMRPPGTFSFTSGYVAFQGIVGCSMLYYLAANRTLDERNRMNSWALALVLVCYLIAIPTSISRTNLFQSTVFVAFLLLAAVLKPEWRNRVVLFVLAGIAAVALLGYSGIADTSMEVFNARFESANEAEGGLARGVIGNRYFGGYLEALFGGAGVPVFGYGLGLGTNAGASLMGGDMYAFGFNGEVEWQRVIGECGFILGLVIIGVRLLFSLDTLRHAYMRLTERADLLPWMMAAGMMLTVPQGQWAIPANLGFCVLAGGFALSAVRTSRAKP